MAYQQDNSAPSWQPPPDHPHDTTPMSPAPRYQNDAPLPPATRPPPSHYPTSGDAEQRAPMSQILLILLTGLAFYLTWVSFAVALACQAPSCFRTGLAFAFAWQCCLLIMNALLYFMRQRQETPFITDVALTIFWLVFLIMTVVRDGKYAPDTNQYFNVCLHAWLAFIMLGSMVVRYPFIIQYAKEAAPPEAWHASTFIGLCDQLSGCWGCGQAFCCLLCLVPLLLNDNRRDRGAANIICNYIVPYLVLIALIVQTRVYPRFVLERYYLRDANGKPLKPGTPGNGGGGGAAVGGSGRPLLQGVPPSLPPAPFMPPSPWEVQQQFQKLYSNGVAQHFVPPPAALPSPYHSSYGGPSLHSSSQSGPGGNWQAPYAMPPPYQSSRPHSGSGGGTPPPPASFIRSISAQRTSASGAGGYAEVKNGGAGGGVSMQHSQSYGRDSPAWQQPYPSDPAQRPSPTPTYGSAYPPVPRPGPYDGMERYKRYDGLEQRYDGVEQRASPTPAYGSAYPPAPRYDGTPSPQDRSPLPSPRGAGGYVPQQPPTPTYSQQYSGGTGTAAGDRERCAPVFAPSLAYKAVAAAMPTTLPTYAPYTPTYGGVGERASPQLLGAQSPGADWSGGEGVVYASRRQAAEVEESVGEASLRYGWRSKAPTGLDVPRTELFEGQRQQQLPPPSPADVSYDELPVPPPPGEPAPPPSPPPQRQLAEQAPRVMEVVSAMAGPAGDAQGALGQTQPPRRRMPPAHAGALEMALPTPQLGWGAEAPPAPPFSVTGDGAAAAAYQTTAVQLSSPNISQPASPRTAFGGFSPRA